MLPHPSISCLDFLDKFHDKKVFLIIFNSSSFLQPSFDYWKITRSNFTHFKKLTSSYLQLVRGNCIFSKYKQTLDEPMNLIKNCKPIFHSKLLACRVVMRFAPWTAAKVDCIKEYWEIFIHKCITLQPSIFFNLTAWIPRNVNNGKEMKENLQRECCWLAHTLSDKISADKIFDGQNFSLDKIFGTKSKFRQFCPTNFFIGFLQFAIKYVLTWYLH